MEAWYLAESPGRYQFGEVPDPEVGPREVKVEIRASALNHIDLWMLDGLPKPKVFPHVPGSDGAGVVIAVGSEVDEVSVGDHVVIATGITSEDAHHRLGIDAVLDSSLQLLGEHRWGTHGADVVVPALAVVSKPGNLSWAEAASYPCGYTTAWRMLRRARAQAGERVLITGIGGGVALAALHLALHLGCEVIASSRDEHKLERARSLGAHEVIKSDAVATAPVDVVLDSIGPAIWRNAVASMRPGARFVTCGGSSGSRLELSLPMWFFRQFELIGSTLGSYLEFREVSEMISAGLPVAVDRVFALDAYPDALEHLRRQDQFGKIVLERS